MPIYNEADAESYDMPEQEFDWASVPDQLSNEDAALERYMEEAADSGVDSPLTSIWSRAQGAFGTATAWAKANPELAKMLAGGIAGGMSAKEREKLMTMKRDWELQDAATKKADAKELWDRRNQSVIDTKTANLGIIGKSMNDNHLAYLQSRKH